jgi:hypothetical protein
MRLFPFALIFTLSTAGRSACAQSALLMPRTIAGAEIEGSAFAHATGALQSSLQARPAGGTKERRCVAPPLLDDSLPGGALRSGDMVVRTRFTGPWGIRAGKGQKLLWLPLHVPDDGHAALLVRAVRLDHPIDSLRESVARPVHAHAEFGYPSNLTFPSPGQWLAVVTAGADWGCFIVTVMP